ncbi:MAG: (Fe-S)-binding protein [Rhodospirillales bacterium]|nr:(Fe-S)-binding protein [Rhodospirillales bacterium]
MIAVPEKPKTVYFFGTCLIDLFYPSAGLAGMELLRREGLRVVFPPNQSCCGQPARNCGFREEARAVARRQIRSFPNPWPIVVPSGSCAGMMREHYAELFAGEPDADEAAAFSERVYELTWFLVHVCKVKLVDRGEPVTVTFHGSCHSQREMGVRDEPKALLRELDQVTFVDLQRPAECCGFGGTFSVRLPEISAAMVADKVADIETSGADEVVSGDCGCLMNIAGAMEKAGVSIRARHIAEFILERCHERA